MMLTTAFPDTAWSSVSSLSHSALPDHLFPAIQLKVACYNEHRGGGGL